MEESIQDQKHLSKETESNVILSLDLEMNKNEKGEVDKIIQIGAVIGDLNTGEVLGKFSVFIKINEPLDPYIIKLTGIQEKDLDSGVSLVDGYNLLKEFKSKFPCDSSGYTWGGDDIGKLKTDLMSQGFEDKFIFGRQFSNVKTVFNLYCKANGLKTKGGLAKSLTRVGLKFEGRKHNALDDAYNTFVLACFLYKTMKVNKR